MRFVLQNIFFKYGTMKLQTGLQLPIDRILADLFIYNSSSTLIYTASFTYVSLSFGDNVKTVKISSLQCTTRTRFLIRLLDGIPWIMLRISRSNPIYCTRSYGIEIRNENSLCEPVLVWLLLPAGNLICVCYM